MIKKTSSLMTIGGIMAAFGGLLAGIPVAADKVFAIILKDGYPHWLGVIFVVMILLGLVVGALGTAIIGVAGKGADDHSTEAQMLAASKQAEIEQKSLDADAAAHPVPPAKVIVEPPVKP